MKKNVLILFVFCLPSFSVFGQLLYDNGPIVTHPGAGIGNADVSAVNSNLQTVWGFRHSMFNGFRVAEDFIIPDANGWQIDSIVFLAYQTSSGNTSTFTDYRMQVWDNSPDNVASSILYGDTVTNVLFNTYWSGIYRTDAVSFTNVDRPLMRNVVSTPGLSLPQGTFWLDWGAFGSTSSGPWVPSISYASPSQTVTGDAIQFSGVNQVWQAITDTNLTTQLPDAQGLPFYIYGSVIAGIPLHQQEEVISNVYPNPVSVSAMISISDRNLGFYTFELYDGLGRKVMVLDRIQKHHFELKRGSLQDGLYHYLIYRDGVRVNDGKIIFE